MTGRRSTGAAPDADPTAEPGGAGAPSVGPGGAEGGTWRAGEEVAGVRLEALVGGGGSGQVWSGTETATGLRVAVKLLHDADAVHRERALLEGLRHPHVLAVRRVLQAPPAVVTELAAGGSLAAQVAARGTLTPGEVVTVLAPLADALAVVHARGVVHGDVTGTNVLFVDRGRPVLADLGAAGLAGDGQAWATPGYAAPEVLAGARPGPAADVHGLAAAGWLALTGAVPPAEEDRLPLRLLAPDCPQGLVDAVTAGLDPDPARRPAPEDLAAAVRTSCPGLPVRLVPAAALGVRPEEAVTYRVRAAAAADPEPVHRGRWWSRGARRALAARRVLPLRRAPGLRVVVAVVLVAVVGGGAVAVVQHRPVVAAPAPAPATAPIPPAAEQVAPVMPSRLAVEVSDLVEAREQALRTGDVAALARVHAPGSVALAADERLVRDGPLDVEYEVLAVVPVRPSDPPGTRSARVTVRTSTVGTVVVEAVVLRLSRTTDGWRVGEVTG